MDDEVDEQLPDVESGQLEVDDEPQADSGHAEIESAANETSAPPPKKRGRGRPRKGESTVTPRADTERRSNPGRSARNKKLALKAGKRVDGAPDEPQAPVPSKPSAKTKSKKPASKWKPTGRPRGRPRKPVEKPTAVVRPTPRAPERQPSTCKWNHCNTTFSSLIALNTHIEEVHFKGLSPFTCAWTGCDRLTPFPALYQLRKHLRGHTGEKSFVCTELVEGVECAKKFARAENLKIHIRREHTNEFPYKCTQCDKAFTNASDWKKHETRTHGGEKPFKCPVDECPKAYTDPSSLRKHMKKKHGEAAYEMASVNKRLNGPKGDYGFVPDGLDRRMPSRSPSPDPSFMPTSAPPVSPTSDQFEPIGEQSTSCAGEDDQ